MARNVKETKMKYAYFNPTVVAVDDVPAHIFPLLKNMVDTAHQHPEHDDQGNASISVRGGQQIQLVPNEFGLDTSVLKDYVEAQCQEYLERIMQVTGRNELIAVKPVLVSAWTIKQQAGHYQALHSHEAHISGNIYIETPELDLTSAASDSTIEFRLPVIKNPGRFVLTDNWNFTPQERKMILFPSYLPHTVYPWRGTGNRTILAWDAKLIDK